MIFFLPACQLERPRLLPRTDDRKLAHRRLCFLPHYHDYHVSEKRIMRAAIVGVGFMGWIHYLAYQRSQTAKLVAFQSRDAAKRAGDWRGIQGNFGPPGEQIDISQMTAYESLDDLLQNPEVDLIDVCLPPYLHGDVVSRALDAGKAVLCEKPLALSAAEAAPLAGRNPGRLMVAHILPFFPEYRCLIEAASSGRFGKLLGGRFKRIIGPPSWIPDFYDPQRVGGPLIDLHVHDAHLIRMLFGMPQAVDTVCRWHESQSAVTAIPVRVPRYVDSLFRFDDPAIVVSAASGVIDQPSRGFTHGFDVQFERANMQFELAAFSEGEAATIPLTIAHQDLSVERPTLAGGDPIDVFRLEIDSAAAAIATGHIPTALDANLAADAIRICEMQVPLIA